MNTTDYAGLDPDLARGIDALVGEVARVVREKRKCCITCVYFNNETEGCVLADGARPPARVVAYGCPKYDQDDIPF